MLSERTASTRTALPSRPPKSIAVFPKATPGGPRALSSVAVGGRGRGEEEGSDGGREERERERESDRERESVSVCVYVGECMNACACVCLCVYVCVCVFYTTKEKKYGKRCNVNKRWLHRTRTVRGRRRLCGRPEKGGDCAEERHGRERSEERERESTADEKRKREQRHRERREG